MTAARENLARPTFLKPTSASPLYVIASTIAAKLASLIRPDGRFTYELNQSGSSFHTDRYNAVRHAGCVWMLREAAKSGIQLGSAPDRATSYLRSHFIVPAPDGVCVAEGGAVKLGANALAVLALLDEPTQEAVPSACLDGLMSFIVAQIRQDGTFVHKRAADNWNEIPFESEYYTGEALFAWLEFSHRFDSGPPARLVSILAQLARIDYGVAQQSHWMLYALSSFYRHAPEQWVLSYAERIVARILTCDEYRTRGSTPIACRTEGLLCYLRCDLSGQALVPQIRSAAIKALIDNLQRQAAFISDDGIVWKDQRRLRSRIDYLQHTLAGFLDSHGVLMATSRDT